jgi:hypothetical protein
MTPIGSGAAGRPPKRRSLFYVEDRRRRGPNRELLPPNMQDPSPWKVIENTDPPTERASFENPDAAYELAGALTSSFSPD